MNQRTLLLMVLSLFLTGCITANTKRNAILPAGVTAWAGISEYVEYGVSHAETDGTLSPADSALLRQKINYLDSALSSGDLDALLLTEWKLIAPWAERGIQARVSDGLISEGVAGSLRETVLRFTYLMSMLGNRMATFMSPSTRRPRQYACIELDGTTSEVCVGTHSNTLVYRRIR